MRCVQSSLDTNEARRIVALNNETAFQYFVVAWYTRRGASDHGPQDDGPVARGRGDHQRPQWSQGYVGCHVNQRIIAARFRPLGAVGILLARRENPPESTDNRILLK
jgi:hypothetical protein